VVTALRYDPNGADLWRGLIQMRLNTGDETGYKQALTQLERLTPGVRYQIVRR
jgi:hypothetical protein